MDLDLAGRRARRGRTRNVTMRDTCSRLTATLRRGEHTLTPLVSVSRLHVRSNLAPARRQRAAGSEPKIDWPEGPYNTQVPLLADNSSGSDPYGSPARAAV